MTKVWTKIWQNEEYSVWACDTERLLYNEATKKVVRHYKQKQRK